MITKPRMWCVVEVGMNEDYEPDAITWCGHQHRSEKQADLCKRRMLHRLKGVSPMTLVVIQSYGLAERQEN